MTKLYYRCDLLNKTTDALIPVPEVWRNVTGMSGLDDATLADMSWSGNADFGFLTEEAAIAAGIKNIDKVKEISKLVRMQSVRDVRDSLLYQSDALVLADRWDNYTAKRKKEISAYRQALRDITEQTDPDNIVWPVLS